MIKKKNILLLFYVILLISGLLLNVSFSNYNYIFLIVFVIVLIFTSKYNTSILVSWGVLSILLTFILFSHNLDNWRYYLIDIANLFVFFSLLSTILNSDTNILFKRSKNIFVIYILLFFIMYFVGSFVSENGRYVGLLGSINFSATVILFMQIFLIEYLLSKNCLSLNKFLLLIGSFVLLIILTRTRSLLLSLPYWIYVINLLIKNKSRLYKFLFYSIVLIVSIGFVLFFDFDILFFDLRLSLDETSLQSRSLIQSIIIKKITSNYFVFPSGFNDAYETISLYVGKKFPVHNDLLNYWNNWGVVFLLFVAFLFKFIRKINMHISLLFLVYAGACLHNLMFSIPLLLPFFMSIKLSLTNKTNVI